MVAPLRTRIYIDGYNLYYGCLKGTPYKWLDLLSLFEQKILPSVTFHDEGGVRAEFQIHDQAIKYFTAQIIERAAKSSDSVSCQAIYHTALKRAWPGRVELVKGYYSMHEMTVRVIDPANPDRPYSDCAQVQAWKLEEKQSDVNLALHAYHDAVQGDVDHIVIVTNDTDIAPALKMVREFTNVKIGLVVPTRDGQRIPNNDLSKLAHWTRKHITEDELKASQLPRVIPGRKATVKPDSWYSPEMVEIMALAIEVTGRRSEAFKWLGRTNDRFGGRVPLEMAESSEGAREVLEYIRAYIANKQAAENA